MFRIAFNAFILSFLRITVVNAFTLPAATFINGVCPDGFTRVSNGCYYFDNSTTRITWQDASKKCAQIMGNISTIPPTPTHLLLIDSEAEAVALTFWFKGQSLTKTYWTGGYFDTNTNLWRWEWINLPYVSFVSHISDANIQTNPYLYLFFNSTQQYEYGSTGDTATYNYICEAQVQSKENLCLNGGTSYVNSGTTYCYCAAGYSGLLCHLLNDNCLTLPCQHGADCNNLVNNYTCNCTQFYTGYNCDIPLPDPLENLRTWIFYLSISIFVLLMTMVCLLDLPWIRIIKLAKYLFPSSTEKALRIAEEKANQKPVYKEAEVETKKKINLIKPEVLMNSEEEMLKRFKKALVQSKQRNTRGRETTPTHLDVNSRIGYDKDFYF